MAPQGDGRIIQCLGQDAAKDRLGRTARPFRPRQRRDSAQHPEVGKIGRQVMQAMAKATTPKTGNEKPDKSDRHDKFYGCPCRRIRLDATGAHGFADKIARHPIQQQSGGDGHADQCDQIGREQSAAQQARDDRQRRHTGCGAAQQIDQGRARREAGGDQPGADGGRHAGACVQRHRDQNHHQHRHDAAAKPHIDEEVFRQQPKHDAGQHQAKGEPESNLVDQFDKAVVKHDRCLRHAGVGPGFGLGVLMMMVIMIMIVGMIVLVVVMPVGRECFTRCHIFVPIPKQDGEHTG